MTEGLSDRAQILFDRAVELPPEQRAAFLDLACPDAVLRAEVEALLAHDAGPTLATGAGGRLKSPLVRRPRAEDTPGWPYAEEPPPARVGDYAILRKIGQGGMGVVFLAEQTNPPRTVALKVLGASDRFPAARERLRVEAESIARLQHPHIVEIFEVGEHDGRPFLVLEYLDGGSLEERLREGVPRPAAAAALVRTLARAIHFAHCRGVIHRDLKPGNILFSRDGVAKIADFGLALAEGGPADLTGTQQPLGTPAYMAPEQARADRQRLGPATDVYALGVILYECLAGRRPFPGESPLEVMHAVVHGDPVPPRRCRPGVPRDLEAICLRCLHKEPEGRYPSAWELAEDLERFEAGRPTRARPVGVAGRFGRWCARHPAPAALLAALAAVFLISFGLVTAEWREADRQRRKAERKAEDEACAREAAEQLRRDLARESCLAMLRLGIGQAEEGFVAQGLHSMARALTFAEEQGMADHERVIRLNLAHWQRRLILSRTHPLQKSPIKVAAPSPDGRWLAVVEAAGRAGRLWDLAREGAPALPLGENVSYVAFSRDGDVLLAAAGAGAASEVRLWRRRADGGEPGFEPWGPPIRLGEPVEQLLLSADRQTLVVRLSTAVQLWNLSGRSLRAEPLPYEATGGANGPVALDETTLLTLGRDDTVCRWDLRTAKPAGPPLRLAPPATNAAGVRQQALLRALSPDGRTLAAAVVERVNNPGVPRTSHVRLWDVATGQPRHPSPTVSSLPLTLHFSPDGRVLAVTRAAAPRREEELQLYDVASGQPLGRPLPQPGGTSALAFGADGRLLVTACPTSGVQFWETATRQLIGQPATVARAAHDRAVAVAVGRLVIAAAFSGGPQLWDVPPAGVGWSSLPAPSNWAVPLSVSVLSPDGRAIAVNTFQDTVSIWDLASGRAVTPPLRHDKPVTSVAFAPKGDALLTGCADGSVWLWEVPSGRRLGLRVRDADVARPSHEFRALLSPDGSTLLTAGVGEAGRLWDADTGRPREADLRHAGRVHGGAFSRDGREVATVGADGFARVWETGTGRPLACLAHPAGVLTAAFGPDGARLLTGCEDGAARLWDIDGGTPLQSWTHRAPVVCTAFSPDGRICATGTMPPDGRVRLWDAATGLPLGPPVGPLGVPEHVAWLKFSPDGRGLLMGGIGSTLPRRWDLPEPVSGSAGEVESWLRERTGTEMVRQ